MHMGLLDELEAAAAAEAAGAIHQTCTTNDDGGDGGGEEEAEVASNKSTDSPNSDDDDDDPCLTESEEEDYVDEDEYDYPDSFKLRRLLMYENEEIECRDCRNCYTINDSSDEENDDESYRRRLCYYNKLNLNSCLIIIEQLLRIEMTANAKPRIFNRP